MAATHFPPGAVAMSSNQRNLQCLAERVYAHQIPKTANYILSIMQETLLMEKYPSFNCQETISANIIYGKLT